MTDAERTLETLNYQQLRQYVLGRIKPLVDDVRKHILEDPVGSIDFQYAFYSMEMIRVIRQNLAQFKVNSKNPRKAPTDRAREATDYSFRRIVYPIVADLAKALYLRAEEANARNTDAAVRYVPILVMYNQQNAVGYPPRIGILVTPAVITFLRGWKVFADGDDAHQHYLNAVTKDAAQIHGVESAEPGQMLYCFNWDPVFAGTESDPENSANTLFSFGTMYEPVFIFQIQIARTKDGQRKFIHRRGGLAPFTNDSPLDLSRYQIERTGEGFANSKDTCFLYALKQSKQLSDEEIRHAAFHINQSAVTFNMADAIGKRLYIRFHMHMDGRVVLKGATGRDLPEGVSLRNIHLGFDFNHYYIFDQALPYSKCYINHIKAIMEHKVALANANIRGVYLRDSVNSASGKRVVFEYHRDDRPHTCTSRDLILALHEQGLLPPIRTDDALAIKESFIREEHYEEDVLEYCEGQLKEIVPAKRPKMPQRVWFADFETATSTTRSSSASTGRTTRRGPSGRRTTRASSRWSSPPSRASPSSAVPSRCTSTT